MTRRERIIQDAAQCALRGQTFAVICATEDDVRLVQGWLDEAAALVARFAPRSPSLICKLAERNYESGTGGRP